MLFTVWQTPNAIRAGLITGSSEYLCTLVNCLYQNKKVGVAENVNCYIFVLLLLHKVQRYKPILERVDVEVVTMVSVL